MANNQGKQIARMLAQRKLESKEESTNKKAKTKGKQQLSKQIVTVLGRQPEAPNENYESNEQAKVRKNAHKELVIMLVKSEQETKLGEAAL